MWAVVVLGALALTGCGKTDTGPSLPEPAPVSGPEPPQANQAAQASETARHDESAPASESAPANELAPSPTTDRAAGAPPGTAAGRSRGPAVLQASPPDQDIGGGGPGEAGDTTGGVAYTYYDGDDLRTVWLASAPSQVQVRAASESGDGLGQQAQPGDPPVFYSESGTRMTLPGGVILLLDPNWGTARVDGFFAANGIARTRASELGWIDNGFVVETDPGLASLELANALATQQGVVISSPDWVYEPVAD